MTLMLHVLKPIQEVAAERATLDRLIALLRPLAEPVDVSPLYLGGPRLGAIAELGLALVVDPDLPPDEIHFRPIRPARQEAD